MTADRPVQLPDHGTEGRLWAAVLDVADAQPSGWTLIGALMVMLHAHDHGLDTHRTTRDADALVDVRGIAQATRRLVATLEHLGCVPLPSAIEPDACAYRTSSVHSSSSPEQPPQTAPPQPTPVTDPSATRKTSPSSTPAQPTSAPSRLTRRTATAKTCRTRPNPTGTSSNPASNPRRKQPTATSPGKKQPTNHADSGDHPVGRQNELSTRQPQSRTGGYRGGACRDRTCDLLRGDQRREVQHRPPRPIPAPSQLEACLARSPVRSVQPAPHVKTT